MAKEYAPDDMLPLSGLQHFLFCRRQWALIHIEQQWRENVLTAEGRLLHEKADDPFTVELRKGIVIARAVPVASPSLGLSGVCDVVEYTPAAGGVQLPGRTGAYLAAPVEYKRGKPKHEPSDEAQLCAQAICLEEMLMTSVPSGYLFYGQTRRRVPVLFTAALRELVRKAAAEMHAFFARGYTPKVKRFKGCQGCSLVDVCLPPSSQTPSVTDYIRARIEQIEGSTE